MKAAWPLAGVASVAKERRGGRGRVRGLAGGRDTDSHLGKCRKALSASTRGAPGASGSAVRVGMHNVASANAMDTRSVATATAVPTMCLRKWQHHRFTSLQRWITGMQPALSNACAHRSQCCNMHSLLPLSYRSGKGVHEQQPPM